MHDYKIFRVIFMSGEEASIYIELQDYHKSNFL